jgi:hypothetical protein
MASAIQRRVPLVHPRLIAPTSPLANPGCGRNRVLLDFRPRRLLVARELNRTASNSLRSGGGLSGSTPAPGLGLGLSLGLGRCDSALKHTAASGCRSESTLMRHRPQRGVGLRGERSARASATTAGRARERLMIGSFEREE